MTAVERPAPAAPWNALSIVAFVLAFVVPVGAIVCGHIALAQLRTSGEQGHGLALAGTIIGYAATGMAVLFVLVWFGVLLASFGAFFGVLAHLPSTPTPAV